MNPASRVSKGVTCRNGDALSGLEVQGKNSIRDLQNAVKTMELDPLVLPSTICLFCLDNDKLTSTAGTASFSRIDSLRRNIDGVRLSYYNQDVPIVCPYPSCDTALQGVNRFKNHAAEVKYESRACMERKSGDPWDYWYYFSVGLLESVDGGALAGLRTLYGDWRVVSGAAEDRERDDLKSMREMGSLILECSNDEGYDGGAVKRNSGPTFIRRKEDPDYEYHTEE
ncbi:hypothetical protein MMC28_004265 [Mycoblastus sanguinarius]|nr:hypothetical protein [Mycoblastus sanguinarius]